MPPTDDDTPDDLTPPHDVPPEELGTIADGDDIPDTEEIVDQTPVSPVDDADDPEIMEEP